MEFNEMISDVLYTVITVICPIVVAYIVKFIKAKVSESNAINKLTENENLSNLVKDAISNVLDAVVYVNQVYVDSLKKSGEFTEEAQNEAFNRAYVEAINTISTESKDAVEKLYGSFDNWLKLKIETAVNNAKK